MQEKPKSMRDILMSDSRVGPYWIHREEETEPREPFDWGIQNLGDNPFQDLLTEDGLNPYQVVESKAFRK